MPRQKPEFIEFVKGNFQYAGFVKDLIEHIEAIELELKVSKEDEQEAVRKYGEAELNIDRLIENCGQLKIKLDKANAEKEKAVAAWLELEKQVPKKVSLPKCVADDVKARLKANSGMIYSAIHNFVHNAGISPLTNKWVNSQLDCNLIVKALVNGYTVEKTKDERLREGIEKTVAILVESTTPPDSNELKIKMLANAVTAYVTKFNADNG